MKKYQYRMLAGALFIIAGHIAISTTGSILFGALWFLIGICFFIGYSIAVRKEQ